MEISAASLWVFCAALSVAGAISFVVLTVLAEQCGNAWRMLYATLATLSWIVMFLCGSVVAYSIARQIFGIQRDFGVVIGFLGGLAVAIALQHLANAVRRKIGLPQRPISWIGSEQDD